MITSKAKPVIVLGAGGHAKVVADVLKQSGRKILGLIDIKEKKGASRFGLLVLGDDNDLDQYDADDIELANGVGALSGKGIRWDMANRMRIAGYTFSTIIHPSAIIAESVLLREGVQVMAGCVIQPEVSIGLDSIINTGSLIDHDCEIGSNCHIAPGVSLNGGVKIGDGTHIGTGAVALQYVSIGKNAVVAAGSVVNKDIQSDTTFIQRRQIIEK